MLGSESQATSISAGPIARRPVVLDMVWEDIEKALDVHPDSYRVRTYEGLYLEELSRALTEQIEASRRRDERQQSKQHQRRGPPPDRQGRLDFALF